MVKGTAASERYESDRSRSGKYAPNDPLVRSRSAPARNQWRQSRHSRDGDSAETVQPPSIASPLRTSPSISGPGYPYAIRAIFDDPHRGHVKVKMACSGSIGHGNPSAFAMS